ncbi:MAG: polysaccharide biosynthesis tyrosine autokinase [Pirellulaceae bacterium]|nr:polysaccharide biosynthesis tyrosine autokinase [Pirellulaceae bacterium]
MLQSNQTSRSLNRRSQSISKFSESLQIDVLQIAMRHFWMIVLSVVACLALGAAYYVTASPTYESTAEILLEPKNEVAATGSVESAAVSDRSLSDDSMASHLAMIQSTRLINEGLAKEKLTDLPSLVKAMNPTHRSPADYIRENLTATRGGAGAIKKAHTIRLSLRHKNAEDCKLLLDAIVKNFQAFVHDKFADDKQRLVETIAKAQSINKQELAEANDAYRKFRQEAPLLWNGRESTNIPRMLYEQIETELNAIQLKKTEIESRLQVVATQLKEINAREETNSANKRTTDIERMALIDAKSAERVGILLQVFAGDATTAEFQSVQPMRISAAQTEAAGLMELRQRQQRLELEYGSLHPSVEALRLQIADMEKFVDDKNKQTSYVGDGSIIDPKSLTDAYLRLLQNDLTDIEAKRNELMAQSAKAKSEARELISYELDGEMLKERVEDLRTLYEATIDKLRDVNLAAGYGGLVSETLEAADIGEPVAPKLLSTLALSIMTGLMLGFSGAALSEFQNRSLRTAQEIERVSDLQILSQIPELKSISARHYLQMVKNSGSQLNPAICTAHDSKSQESEVFRGLRTVLMFRATEEKAKTFAITSANSGDGKSLLSANLATSIAQAGRSVLLMECDLRQPAVAKLFHSDERQGIADVLAHNVNLDSVIFPTEVDNLDILAAGTIPINPAELLASKAFADLIDKLEQQYDFVILDCPPVLAVADPCIISTVADAMLIVVRINPQSRVELRRTVEMLNEVDASVLGVVVNASDLKDEINGNRKNGYMVGYGYGANGAKSNGYYHSKTTSRKKG